MMQVVMNFVFKDVEYMIYEANESMPGTAALELLCSRIHGIGADRILVFSDVQTEPAFYVFTANGRETAAAADDFLVFAHYLRQQNISINSAKFAKILGDTILVQLSEMDKNISCFEARLTPYFCDKMKQLDKNSHILAS